MTSSVLHPLYVASGTVTGGRDGSGSTDDGQLTVDLRVPREMGGPGGGTNPEQLFAVGYAACFHSAMAVVARQERVDITGSMVRSRVTLGTSEAGLYCLAITLSISVHGVDSETAERLVEKAHMVCPYSNAVRHNVDVTLIVE